MLKDKELIIFTGGEPAVQNWYALNDIIYWLKNNSLCKKIEIETNGLRFDLFYHELKNFHDRLVNFSVDFKMHKKGDPEYSLGAYLGYKELGKNDCIKVVVKNREEIDFAMKLAMKFYNTNVFVSPCYGCIDAAEIADYIVNKGYQKLRMQIQLHKYLWGDARGK